MRSANPAPVAPYPDAPVSGRPPLAVLPAVGTAVPPDSYTQHEVLERFGVTDARIRGLFLNGGIERRNLSLPPPNGQGPSESQGELLAKHTRVGLATGRAAVLDCLSRAGREPADIRYLCCVSSTGFLTPGLSALLLRDLGLRTDIGRLDVVGMGCNAGLNGLNATTAWAAANPGQLAVMVCIETCSAAYAFDATMRTAVVNSLFGDGAASIAVVAGEERSAGPAVLRFTSLMIPSAIEAMRYDWSDEAGRFSFYLDPHVPYVVGAHVEQAVDALLVPAGLRRADIAHWTIHSGGRKVIDSVRINLGLSRHDVRHTRSVLRDHGNLSSGSFLFSLRRLSDEGLVSPGDHGVLMTMGPGSTIELALVRW
ncbi:3,5-dihydroxyphenylacetyl-CoA synthase DpgA [Streptomyces anulatus]